MGFELGDKARRNRIGLAVAQQALLNEALCVKLARRWMAGDRPVHQRLCEGRLVGLVVPMAAIAKQINHDVFFEFLTEFRPHAGDVDDSFGIVTIYVEDRRLDTLGHIRRVGARPCGRGRGRKPDLVVDDNVDRSPGAEPDEVREFERDSATRPWPAKAASPCIKMLATWSR